MGNREKFGVELEVITSNFKKKLKEIVDKTRTTADVMQDNFKAGFNVNSSKLRKEIDEARKHIIDLTKEKVEMPLIDVDKAKARLAEVQSELENIRNTAGIRETDKGTRINDTSLYSEDLNKNKSYYPLLEEEKSLNTLIEKGTAYNDRIKAINQELANSETHISRMNNKMSEINTTSGRLGSIIGNIRDKLQNTALGGVFNKMISQAGVLREKLQGVVRAISNFDINKPLGTGLGYAIVGVEKLGAKIKSSLSDKLSGAFNNLKGKFGGMSGVASGFGTHLQGAFNNGIASIKRFSLALLGVRGAWTMLTQQARNYISQNEQLQAQTAVLSAGFQQLLAPAITFIVNLLSTAMSYLSAFIKMLTGVDILKKGMASVAKNANGTAGSMGKTAKSAKEVKGALAGFDEITNIAQDDNSGGSGGGGGGGVGGIATPSFKEVEFPDLDKIGETLAKKLNEAMAKIPWDKIQNGARKIADTIGENINGFILTLDWNLLGYTIGQGLNTAIYFAQTLVHKIKWRECGEAIVQGVNGFFKTVDWSALGDTISTGIAGVLDFASGFMEKLDAGAIVDAIFDFIAGIDWGKLTESLVRFMVDKFVIIPIKFGIALGEKITAGIEVAKQYFKDKIAEAGGNVVEGIFNGIIDGLKSIGQWIYDHIFTPIIDAFKSAFDIHSPSGVMKNLGLMLVQGLIESLKNLPAKAKEVFINLLNTTKEKMQSIRTSIENKFKDIPSWFKGKFSEAWTKIKSVFNASTVGNFFSGIWNTIKSKFTKVGTNIGKAIGGAFKSAVNAVLRTVENVLNSPIRAINSMIGVINKLPGVSIGKLSTFNLPRLDTGTNYVPADTLAMIHKGEAVVPKKFNEDKFFNQSNQETNELIRQFMDMIEDIDFATYLDGKKISQNTVDYINSQNRIMGRSVI